MLAHLPRRGVDVVAPAHGLVQRLLHAPGIVLLHAAVHHDFDLVESNGVLCSGRSLQKSQPQNIISVNRRRCAQGEAARQRMFLVLAPLVIDRCGRYGFIVERHLDLVAPDDTGAQEEGGTQRDLASAVY